MWPSHLCCLILPGKESQWASPVLSGWARGVSERVPLAVFPHAILRILLTLLHISFRLGQPSGPLIPCASLRAQNSARLQADNQYLMSELTKHMPLVSDKEGLKTDSYL